MLPPPPLTVHLNAWAPGANLVDENIFKLMSLCAFDILDQQKRSPWCDVFDQDEDWDAFEYTGDLRKYHGMGFGPISAVCRA